MGVFTDIIDNRNKPKRGLVNEAGSYGGVKLDEEGIARRRKLFFDKLPAFKKRNQRKWEKANPKLNFYDLQISEDNVIKTLKDEGPLTRRDLVKELKIARTTIYDNLIKLQN